METQEKLNIITVILFLLTGILHLLAPLIYGMTFEEATGSFVFGIIYTCLGILVQLKKENKIIGILSILMPLIGLILGIILMPLTVLIMGIIFVLFVLLLDPFIIILRIYLYKQL